MASVVTFSINILNLYSLDFLKSFYSDDRCRRVSDSASVYFVSIFCSCSTVNRRYVKMPAPLSSQS